MQASGNVKHRVLMKVKANTDMGVVASIFQDLDALRQSNLGILDFAGGPFDPSAQGPEGLELGYTHGFIMTFDSRDNRDRYNTAPEHLAIARRIIDNADEGIDGVLAFDFLELGSAAFG